MGPQVLSLVTVLILGHQSCPWSVVPCPTLVTSLVLGQWSHVLSLVIFLVFSQWSDVGALFASLVLGQWSHVLALVTSLVLGHWSHVLFLVIFLVFSQWSHVGALVTSLVLDFNVKTSIKPNVSISVLILRILKNSGLP